MRARAYSLTFYMLRLNVFLDFKANVTDTLLLLLVRLHDQPSSSDEVDGLIQVLQAPISFLVKRSC